MVNGNLRKLRQLWKLGQLASIGKSENRMQGATSNATKEYENQESDENQDRLGKKGSGHSGNREKVNGTNGKMENVKRQRWLTSKTGKLGGQ